MIDDHDTVLSILIPTYNYGEFIDAAIASVLTQRQTGVEIVVADDGSTDDTADVLRPRVEAGEIRYFRQENAGPAAARNLAMDAARGQYLMFLDADDALMPGCVQLTLEFLAKHPEVGLFFTNYDIYDDQGVVNESGLDIWRIFRGIARREVGEDAWVFTENLAPYIVQHGAFMHTSGLTVRAEVVEQVGAFHPGYYYGEDDEFYARVAYATTAGFIDRVLTRKRNHDRSLIHDDGNRLRNAEHLLGLTELQREAYASDPQMQQILHAKARSTAATVGWLLIARGEAAAARKKMREYLRRYPLYAPFYKLYLKSWLGRDS